jgi:hypothetical protein
MFLNFIWPENLPQYSFMCLVFPWKIDPMYSLGDILDLAKLVSRYFKTKFELDLVDIINLVNL